MPPFDPRLSGHGLILSAPSSGAGKTLVTLGVLRALARAGWPVRGAKSGPDYIDPRFHAAATGLPCPNLDAWAMAPATLAALAAGPGLLVIEGAMGLFDGAPPAGRGATADLARHLRLPVVLVVDAARMAGSVAPLVAGFRDHDPEVTVAGVILNRVGSARHEGQLRAALAVLGMPVLGALPRRADLTLPERHLGLVQAEEIADLGARLDRLADTIMEGCDLAALAALARPLPAPPPLTPPRPPGQRIAVASDIAFGFAYPHHFSAWRAAGAEVLPFSPLADEAPAPGADAIFLPGGYPELHAGRLAAAQAFRAGMGRAAAGGVLIWGECGGYMTLGQGLIDATGTRHAMLGLLDLETSFAERRLHLGYRELTAEQGPLQGHWAGHEFHYATTLRASGASLFRARAADGEDLGPCGLRHGRVCGSFAHLIGPWPG